MTQQATRAVHRSPAPTSARRTQSSLFVAHAAALVLCLGSCALAAPLAYVPNLLAGSVSVVDTASGMVVDTIVTGGEPTGVAVQPSGSRVFVGDGSSAGDTLWVIDTASNAVVDAITVWPQPLGVAVHPDGSRVYVASFSGSDVRSRGVSVIDTTTDTVVATIPMAGLPYGLAVNPNGTVVYVATMAAEQGTDGYDSIAVIDVATNTVTGFIHLGFNTQPREVAFNPSGTTAYVTNYVTNTVSVIDVAGGIVTDTIPVDRSPVGIVTSPDGSRIYVANICGLDPVCATPVFGTVSLIDAHARAVIDTVAVGAQPEMLDVDRDGRKLYVACIGADAVDVIDLTTDLVSEQIPVGNGPGGLGRFLGPPASTTTSTSTTTTSLAPSTIPTTTLNPTTSTTTCPPAPASTTSTTCPPAPASTTSTTCPPAPASTTSTTGAVSTTTSTTLPAAGCATEPVAATFPSIGCRLSALRARVDAESALGALGPKLVRNLTRASERLQHAAAACGATNVQGTRRNLTRTARQLGAYGRPLRGPAATRILLPALRQEFLGAGVWIRDDVQRLRQRVVCG
jgi:YVTN family beta-propeller protein